MHRWKGLYLLAVMLLAAGLALGVGACGGDDDDDDNDDASDDTDDDAGDDTGDDDAGDDDDLPGGVDCQDGTNVCYISGVLTQDFTLTADTQWVLRGGVFVGDDTNTTVLTVEPGTTVYGESSTNGMLVITRGSRIEADGTADAPIVFTSSKEDGSRARGDWGGVIINGRAPINNCLNPDETEFCESIGEGGTGKFGGVDPEDNSGTLRYVRVEFAGRIISPDNELNGIAFQGVGSGTTIDYVQVHMNKDDGIEFFGGTASFKHVLITGGADDNLDWTDGWTGMGQFFVCQQYADAGDNGIEADNNGENNVAEPRSHPTLSNVTLVGSPDSEFSDYGILLREGTAGNLSNVVVLGFNDSCLALDHNETFDNAWSGSALSGELTLDHSILSCANLYKEPSLDPAPPFTVQEFFATLNDGNETVADADTLLEDPFNTAAPDFRPVAGSPAESGAAVPADSFFDDVDFRGGVDPSDNWTSGWTTSAAN